MAMMRGSDARGKAWCEWAPEAQIGPPQPPLGCFASLAFLPPPPFCARRRALSRCVGPPDPSGTCVY